MFMFMFFLSLDSSVFDTSKQYKPFSHFFLLLLILFTQQNVKRNIFMQILAPLKCLFMFGNIEFGHFKELN